MMMLETILVPLDGSALAERALPYATRLARAAGGRLVLVRATGARPAAGGTRVAPAAEAEDYLRTARAGLYELAPDRIGAVVYGGDAAEAVLAEVRLRRAGLIVMATHGRGGLGRALYGSVADAVLRHAPAPVLLVPAACERRWPPARPPGAEPGPPRRVLVPLDGSDLAEEALAPAGALAAALGAGLLLAQAVPFPVVASGSSQEDASDAGGPDAEVGAAWRYLEEVAAPLRAAGREVEVRVEAGMVVPTLARIERELDVEGVAMATHGRSGLARAVLGSVATEVLHRTTAPVLLVRPGPHPAPGTVNARP
jgi:nucleotide-binding universal stress UspA family protein